MSGRGYNMTRAVINNLDYSEGLSKLNCGPTILAKHYKMDPAETQFLDI